MAVAEALGFMVHLLSSTALNDQLPKLLPGIMQLYRKHSEHYYISQVHIISYMHVLYTYMCMYIVQVHVCSIFMCVYSLQCTCIYVHNFCV